MSDAHLFAIGVVLAWLAGIRVYLTVFGVGLAGALGWLDLPAALEVTQSPWVIGVSGALAAVEFFADKIPGVDSGWDLLHTLLRVPAGAFLAAATLSPDGQLGAGALATGAGVALTSHLLKAGSRALLNTSPEPVTNWTASVTEDVATVGGLALVFAYPWVALTIVVLITVTFALLLWWVWRKLFRRRKPGIGDGHRVWRCVTRRLLARRKRKRHLSVAFSVSGLAGCDAIRNEPPKRSAFDFHREVVLLADAIDQRQLRLDPVDVFFFGREDVGEQLAADDVLDALAVDDAFAQHRQRFQFQRQVAGEHFARRFADAQLAQRLEVRQALEEENALRQLVGMLHLVDGLVVFVLGEFLQAPVLQHLGVQEVLVDRDELVVERLVEVVDDLGVALHGPAPCDFDGATLVPSRAR